MPALYEVEGGAQLRKTLRAAGDDLSDLKAAHGEAAQIVTGRARGTAPRRTGVLSASVRGSGTKTQAVVRAGGARVRYAGPIHWGWPARGIAAQPWIQEAAQDTEPVWIGRYEDAVDEALDKVKGI